MRAAAHQHTFNFRPQKPRPAGTTKAMVATLYDQVGGVGEVMTRLMIGKSQAYAFADPVSPEEISLARVAALTSPRATAAAQHLAQRAGGVFVPLPAAAAGCPMALTADSVREHGEAVGAALDALAAKQASPAARARVLKEIDDAIRALAALRGHFTDEGGQ